MHCQCTAHLLFLLLRLHHLLLQARENLKASTARVWMKSAIVEREAEDNTAQRKLLEEGLRRFPTDWKLWMMLGQVSVCGPGLGQGWV